MFGTAGTALALGARWLTQVIPWAALLIGVALVGTGIALVLGRRVTARMPIRPSRQPGRRAASSLVFGVAYGLTSLSCTLPLFLVVVGTAVTGTALGSVLMFASYAAGMGTILTALAVAAAFSRSGLARSIRGLLPHVSRVSGLLLVAAGVYVVYYWAFFLLPGGATRETGSKPIDIGRDLSSELQDWLGGSTGKSVTAVLFAVLIGLGAWAIFRRIRPPSAIRESTPSNEAAPSTKSGNSREPVACERRSSEVSKQTTEHASRDASLP